jgi:hypothetical protein
MSHRHLPLLICAPAPTCHAMLRLLMALFLFALGRSLNAQDTPASALATEYAFTIEAAIAAAMPMGMSVDGERRSIPITGGSVNGAEINGEVIPGGADYQVTRGDGTTLLRAVYMIRTEDGVLVNVVNEGYIVPPGTRGNDALYFRTSPQFTAPTGKYGWLNNTIFVSAIRFRTDKPGVVIIDVYKVL